MRPVAVVTGASGGIGRWIARGLAERGHHVVLLCRDAGRGRAAREWVGHGAELVLADLSLLHEARRAGQAIAASHPAIAVLVNNAGIFTARREETAEGHETVLALNHLAPAVLTDALEPALISARGRIVNVGSSTSDSARIDPDDLELTRRWGYVRAYGQSKLALMMDTFTRAERLRPAGVVCNVVHPGTVATGLIRERGPIGWAWRLMAPFTLTAEQGADTPLHVATSGAWADRTGLYAKKRDPTRPNPLATDPALRARVDAATRGLVARTLGSA